jgi:uncharacterized protein DUF4405
MFSKAKWNFIIDVLMMLLMTAMLGIGLAVKYILPPGKVRQIEYGGGVDLYIFGMERHQWGDIHYYLGVVLLGLLLLHIILHWSVILSIYRRLIGSRGLRAALAWLFVAVNTVLVTIPFCLTPEVREETFRDARQGTGRRYSQTSSSTDESGLHGKRQSRVDSSKDVSGQPVVESQEDISPGQEPADILTEEDIPPQTESSEHGLQESEEAQHEHKGNLEIRGYLSLAQVADKYDVPIEHLEQKLDLPASMHRNDKLGWLRRQYGFRMSDIEKIVIQYSHKEQ